MTDIKERLKRAEQQQASYRPNADVARHMNDVTFVALIGITGIGKSHLIPHITARGGSDFSELDNISTRAIRPSDPPTFRGNTSFKELLDKIDRHELVSYVVHPSGDIYASDTDSFTSKFVLLPTLTSALPQLEALRCFKKIVPIGLVTDGLSWESRFKDKLGDSKLGARLDEALVCLDWLEIHSKKVPIINNQTGRENETATMIINILRQDQPALPLPGTLELLEELRIAVKKQYDRLMSYNHSEPK